MNLELETNLTTGCKILVVDDEPRNTTLLCALFSNLDYEVQSLNDSCLAIQKVSEFEPDLIILDVMMPGISGFELTEQLKSNSEFFHIPIILLTALSDRESCIKGLNAGAEDFLSKPFDRRELQARVNNLMKLKKLHDFLRQNIRILQEYDIGTGLPNTTLLKEFTESRLLSQGIDITMALCEIDRYDELKAVLNIEDGICKLSRAVVERMSRSLPEGVFIGCLEPGRFGIILECNQTLAGAYLEELKLKLSKPFHVIKPFFLKFTFGVVSSIEYDRAWQALLHKAELALIEAKTNGGNSILHFCPEMDASCYQKWWIYQALSGSIEKGQLFLHFQPQFKLKNKKLFGFEILLRWHHPEKGLIGPAEFIPAAEECGLIGEIGLWVFSQSCNQMKKWKSLGYKCRLAVNVSALQLHDDLFMNKMRSCLELHGVKASDFELELTEGALIDEACVPIIWQLKDIGFELSIDDFGTGYSNLEHLKKYPFSRLKIDRSFISNLCHSSEDEAIVHAIVAIAYHMNLIVLAEGVENAEQLEKLQNLGCKEIQGYYFGKPMPESEATLLLAGKIGSE